MYLKSLTLRGFKSFAQATTFAFEPGVTAIIGPNGSGKSNVLDALAWVMGEQGAKTLRGGKMEDVIFAGTASRGPLGRAEVKLTIDNSDGALPIEYTEVTISRTLFRNGTSEYAINGENCRLLDVQELLSDSGLGSQMHVIVGQGQLDTVLRASPEQRRGFIEEAAGILKHRRRRERTLRKLEAMEANLTRLNDLAAELRRQLKPLGKQAQQAKQAQQLAAIVRDAKARIFADDIAQLQAQVAELSQTDAERSAARSLLQEQLETQQQRIAQLETNQVSEELDAARRLVIEFESQLAKLRGLQTQANQRLQFLTTQDEPTDVIQQVTAGDVERVAKEVQRLSELVPAAERELAAANSDMQTAQEQLREFDSEIATQRTAQTNFDLQLAKLHSAQDGAKQRLQDRTRAVEQFTAAVAQAQEQLHSAEAALAAYQKAHPVAVGTALQTHTDQLEQQHQQASAHLQQAENERDRLQAALHQHERELTGLQATVAALAGQIMPDDASAEVLAADLPGVLGSVAESITVQPDQAAAVGVLLGAFNQAVLVQDAAAARRALDYVKTHELGQLRTVIAEFAGADAQVSPAELQLATEHNVLPVVQLINAPTGVQALLQHSFVAPNLQAAQEFAQAYSSIQRFFTVATPNGELCTAVTATGGSAGAKTVLEVASLLQLAQTQLAQTETAVVAAQAALQAAQDRVLQHKDAVRIAAEHLRQADAERAEHAAALTKFQADVDNCAQEVLRATERAQAALAQQEQAQQVLAGAAQACEQLQRGGRPEVALSGRDELAAQVERLRGVEVDKRLECASAKERLRSAENAYRRIREQFHAAERAAQERARRAVARNRQAANAQQVLAVLPEFLSACENDLTRARTGQQLAEQERAKHAQELTLLRSQAAQVRQDLAQVTENAHATQLRLHERRIALQSLTDRVRTELALDVSTLLAEYGAQLPVPVVRAVDADLSAPETVPVPYVRAEQQQRLAEAERELAELGRINPLALEEFSALEQRHNYLHEQLADLAKTKQDLLRIVHDLDAKMESIFAAAFADTQTAFAEVFPVLFPGGTGKIALTDPDNLLTTGIEITVKPAGKKVERMSLLSGGERSLAAVAWLIAIFKARPSPFYILDEVEAALDDANLGRLLQAFADLRQHSQLIVITHQKRTMEIADALYGVSMRSDGVSAVVGQRLQQGTDEA